MIRLALAAALTLAVPAFAADATFDKTIPASPNVSIATGSGYIHVSPGTDAQIHIVGHVHANQGWMTGNSDEKIKEIVAKPPIEQSGNSALIGNTHNDSLYQNVSIDYDVTLPRATSLKAATGSGAIRISGITGTDQVRASTGSGSIHIEGVSSGLNATTGSGSIEVAGNPVADWRLTTGSGGIRLNAGTSAKFNLNASTGSGTVHVSQPITMQGTLDHHHVAGVVNGGGPTIRASTGSGSITIE